MNTSMWLAYIIRSSVGESAEECQIMYNLAEANVPCPAYWLDPAIQRWNPDGRVGKSPEKKQIQATIQT